MGLTDQAETGDSIVVSVANARAAYEALKSKLDAIPPAMLIEPRVDSQKAAIHALGLVERDRDAVRAAGFDAIAAISTPRIIMPEPLKRYELACLAAWYARQQQLRFAFRSQGSVSPAVAEKADGMKRRMLKLLDYYFGEDPVHSVDLAAIRAGHGYVDTANDLQMLADLYEVPEIAAKITRDSENYRETDVLDARMTAGEMLRALGFDASEAAEWTARVRRAYTHLTDSYAEHCNMGRLLFFRTENVDVTYPTSLISAVRLPRSAPKKQDVTDGESDENGGGGPGSPAL